MCVPQTNTHSSFILHLGVYRVHILSGVDELRILEAVAIHRIFL